MKKENIHDRLFKHTLSIPSEAKALVRQFLPNWIHENLDFRKFKLNTQSFVNEALDEYFTDIVYDCYWKGNTNLKVSFLLEHKSYPDKFTPLQLLRYLTEAYIKIFSAKEELTLIIPIVIYHDDRKWKKRTFSSLFELPDKRLRQYVPTFDFETIDLPTVSDEFLFNLHLGHYLRSTLLVFKHKNDKSFIQQFTEEIFIFVEAELSAIQKQAFTKALLIYIFQVFKLNRQEFQSFSKKVTKMTGVVPGSLYDQAIKKGLREGLKEGLEKGVFLKLVESVQNMTAMGLDIELMAKISGATQEQIQALQKDLLKTSQILKRLKKKEAKSSIAKNLAVSEQFVDAIQKLNESKE